MKTKEVTISNIKFNLSTEPLVSEPEVYPDYKYDMSTEELSNRLTQILQGIIINEEPNLIQGFVQNFIENFEYLAKILKDDAIDTWTLREQEEINKLDLTQGLHIFLYDIYTGIISHCQTNKPTNQEPIYESEHIIILDSDSTLGCQE